MKYILIMTAVISCLVTACKQERTKIKPNILFVFMDDMGYADLGCYGNTRVQTPNIDQLAKEGILFTQFYVNTPICSPSHTAITTRQYPYR